MYKYLLCYLILFATLSTSFAQDLPAWAKKLPKAGNNTFMYVCEWGVGPSETSAANQALGKVFQTTANRMGQPFDSKKVNEALQKGTDYEVISRQYNIPINKVCDFSLAVQDGYKVYVLCQVAVSATLPVQFEAFRKCGRKRVDAPASVTWDYIKSNPGQYYFAEGVGEALEDADADALRLMLGKIFPTANPASATFATAAAAVADRMIISNEPDAKVGRYVKRDEVGKLFAGRKNKIKEYVRLAQLGEASRKLDDALRNYYWALALVNTLPNPNEMTFDDNGQQRLLVTWIPVQMDAIFENITLAVNKVDGSMTELGFSYKGKPVATLDFTYFDGRDWSNICSVNNGKGVIDLISGSDAQTVQVKFEYAYKGQSHIDKEVSDVLAITKGKPLRKSYASLSVSQPVEKAPKPVVQQLTSSQESVPAVSSSNKVGHPETYDALVRKVVEAIKSRQYASVKSLFTTEGYAMYDSLIHYGKARVLDFQSCTYARLGDRVIARSIPMSFSFARGVRKNFVENIVLTFDANQKIECVAFGLDEVASQDILARTAYSEAARQTIVTFLENYKTAYALKRLDYIESIFDDNAVIIIGHIVKRYEAGGIEGGTRMANKYVQRTQLTKEQYIKNLRACFRSNEFVNIRFANNDVKKAGGAAGDTYGIQIKQDYYSTNYGDAGYLYLQVDLNDPDQPIIRVRTWQEEPDPELNRVYGMEDF